MQATDAITERALQEVATLVGISSWSHDPEGLAECAEVVADLLSPLADDVTFVDLPDAPEVRDDGTLAHRRLGRAVHASARPGAERRVLLVGHLDTVFPPGSGFEGVTVDDGTWRGPGVVDAKGGIAVMAGALRLVSDRGIDVGWDVVVVPDEEIGSPGSAPLLADLASRATLGLGYEPAMPDGSIAGARPGSANYVHIVRGLAAHAGRELHLGRNAILAAARLAESIDALNEHPDVLANPGRIAGGTGSNIVPDLAVLRSNVRPATDDAATFVTEHLADAIRSIAVDGIEIDQHGGMTRPPKEMTDRYRSLLDDVVTTATDLGMTLGWKDTGGVCDGNNLAGAGLVNVDNIGPVGGDLHRPSEYLDTTSLAPRIRLSAELITRFATP